MCTAGRQTGVRQRTTNTVMDQSSVEAGAHVGPGDPRYQAVLDKQFNKRFKASPDYVVLASTTAEVVGAVQEAVTAGLRVVATSGGHCLEGFVSDPDVRVIVDVSPMKAIEFDSARGAIAVGAGATVGETFTALADRWGTVVPLGEYPHIGMGGHIAGGAFGFLCRELGLAADYLHAVEVVTVDRNGQAAAVFASAERDDPNRDLWWAHTGGGAGNFGIVTRYWFRSPDAAGSDPSRLLPRAPASVMTFRAEWEWSAFDRAAFVRLLENHGRWGEAHSGPQDPGTALWTLLELHRQPAGKIVIRGLTTAGADAEQLIKEHVAAVSAGLPPPHGLEPRALPWLDFALNPFPDLFGGAPPEGVSSKVKDALLRRRFTARQAETAFDFLTGGRHPGAIGMLGFASYGGRVNAATADATAAVQRGAIFDMACNTGWVDPAAAEVNLAWVRDFYRALFTDTGGVPVPGAPYDGSLINHPDTDHADRSMNTSGVPWSTIYYQDNYPRLQQIKARWDARNVFRHALSIQLP